RIEVSIPGDSRVYYGTLVGEDRETDLAVVKITVPRALPVAHLGDSRRLAVGDWVVAIGSPFGLDASVTTGIISALHRAMDPSQQFEDFIQTDAPVNPGNSGGPLIDLHGDVIGINTAIYSDGDAYQGVAFALPSDLVKHVYPQLVRQGYVRRGSIGIYFEAQVDPAVRRVYHLEQGVPLSQVEPRGPAAGAGMRAGDVIVSLDGAPVANGDTLMRAIADAPVGRRIEVGYQRDGHLRRAGMAIGDRARLFSQSSEEQPPPVAAPAAAVADFGMELRNTTSGPRVRDVEPDTFADRIGVAPEDVIIEINHTAIRQVVDVDHTAAGARPGEDVAVVVRRPNGDGTESRWLLGGTLPPSYRNAQNGQPAGKRP
ncbi:MAG: PDZ domain-containing protein, partial [Terriglobales bacterium]